MFNSLFTFYRSDAWESFRKQLQLERVNENGDVICEHCGKPIIHAYDCIAHHKTALTEMNVNDFTISLNPENIMLVHHRCHNQIHSRFGSYTRHIYIVYGSPCSGKSTYVKESALKEDLIVDIDKIYQAISVNEAHDKSNRLTSNVFQIRDMLLDAIRTRNGRWINAWIVGGYPLKMDRERLASTLGAELVFIEANKELCLARAESSRPNEYKKFIEDWFNRYQP